MWFLRCCRLQINLQKAALDSCPWCNCCKNTSCMAHYRHWVQMCFRLVISKATPTHALKILTRVIEGQRYFKGNGGWERTALFIKYKVPYLLHLEVIMFLVVDWINVWILARTLLNAVVTHCSPSITIGWDTLLLQELFCQLLMIQFLTWFCHSPSEQLSARKLYELSCRKHSDRRMKNY